MPFLFPACRGKFRQWQPTCEIWSLFISKKSAARDSGRPFLRIASIDSPFRELVAWAYLQIACRPSLPDRDFDSWRDEIVEDVKNRGGSRKET